MHGMRPERGINQLCINRTYYRSDGDSWNLADETLFTQGRKQDQHSDRVHMLKLTYRLPVGLLSKRGGYLRI